MILGLIATAAAAWTVEVFSSGAMLGIAVYTAARGSKKSRNRRH